MKKVLKTTSVLSLLLMVVLAALPGKVEANQEAQEQARKAAERAVSSAIQEVLSETIVEQQEKQQPKTTLFATPSMTNIEITGGLAGIDIDAEADVVQILAGVVSPINDKVFFTGSLSYSLIDMEIEADSISADAEADYILLDAGLVGVLASSDSFKSWMTFGINYGYFEVEGYDVDFFGAKAGVTLDNSLTEKVSLLSSVNLNVSKANESDSDESYAMDIGTKLKYNGDKVQPSFEVKYLHGFAPDSDGEDSQFLNLSPAVEYMVSDATTLGVSYTYSTLLNDDDFGIEIESHTASFNYRYMF